MRFCFYNPQVVDNVGQTLFSTLVHGKKNSVVRHNMRYGYLVNILRSRKNVAIIVDGTVTSLSAGSTKYPLISENYFLLRVFSFFEILIWCLLNDINPLRTKIIFFKDQLNEKEDILFGFGSLTDTFLSKKMTEKSFLTSFKGKKLLHANHFFGRTSWVAHNIKKTNTITSVAEANLLKSPYFMKYYPFIKQFIILPHVLRDRYKRKKDFSKRLNKCVALGTLTYERNVTADNKDLITFFKNNTLHPMRKDIYENKDKITEYIDSLIHVANPEESTFGGEKAKGKLLLDRILKKSAVRYHQFNIVDTYNSYKMFVSPEESVGLPSVNFIEGMACGTAYIGLKHQMYTDIGMKEGYHYIGYNGTLNDLVGKISYYQSHPKELKQIAENGYKFVKQNFTEGKIIGDFYTSLSEMA